MLKRKKNILEDTFVIINEKLELTVKDRDDCGECGTGGVGMQKCAGLPYTSQLKFSLLASLLLLSCDETDAFAAAIFIVI